MVIQKFPGGQFAGGGQSTSKSTCVVLTAFGDRPASSIIGSAEALPILCVSDFCERERERERETPVTSIDITLKSRVIMYMITSTARTRRPVLSLSSVHE